MRSSRNVAKVGCTACESKKTQSRLSFQQYNGTWSFGPVPKFEESLERLEKIVDELEKGNVPLEQALKLFEEGMQLSSSCRKELEEAEGKVEILLKQNGKLQPEPLDQAAAKR
ncbi:MAG TPA: exodeoxyribonuclease VII small subunit [Candidatus Angelobacter sp.]